MRWIAAVALVVTAAGCASSTPSPTMFFGNSKIMNGPAGCQATCDAWGMDLAGMVKMGDYTDGCICQVRPKPPAGDQAAPAAAPAAPPAKEPAAPASAPPAPPPKKGGTSANDAAKAGSAMTAAAGAVMVQLAMILAEYKAPDPFQP